MTLLKMGPSPKMGPPWYWTCLEYQMQNEIFDQSGAQYSGYIQSLVHKGSPFAEIIA